MAFFSALGAIGFFFAVPASRRSDATPFEDVARFFSPVALFRSAPVERAGFDPVTPLGTVAFLMDLPGVIPAVLLAPDFAAFFFGATLTAASPFFLEATFGRATADTLAAPVAGFFAPPAFFPRAERTFAAAFPAAGAARPDTFFGLTAFFATMRFTGVCAPFVTGVRFLAMVLVGQVPR
jgi:hypothetical protein